jgi:hypothetical protein
MLQNLVSKCRIHLRVDKYVYNKSEIKPYVNILFIFLTLNFEPHYDCSLQIFRRFETGPPLDQDGGSDYYWSLPFYWGGYRGTHYMALYTSGSQPL